MACIRGSVNREAVNAVMSADMTAANPASKNVRGSDGGNDAENVHARHLKPIAQHATTSLVWDFPSSAMADKRNVDCVNLFVNFRSSFLAYILKDYSIQI